MSMTNQQRRKQAKVKNRVKRLLKLRKIRQNEPKKRYRLDVFHYGIWNIGVCEWSYIWQAEAHKRKTEESRAKGEEIAPGRIIDLVGMKVIIEIEGSKSKGVAPDKIADGSKAAEPNILKKDSVS